MESPIKGHTQDTIKLPRQRAVLNLANLVLHKIDEANPPKYTDQDMRTIEVINPNSGDFFTLKETYLGARQHWIEIWHPDFEDENEVHGLNPLNIYELFKYEDTASIAHFMHMQDSKGRIAYLDTFENDPNIPFQFRYAAYREFMNNHKLALSLVRQQEDELGLSSVDRQRVRRLSYLLSKAVLAQESE